MCKVIYVFGLPLLPQLHKFPCTLLKASDLLTDRTSFIDWDTSCRLQVSLGWFIMIMMQNLSCEYAIAPLLTFKWWKFTLIWFWPRLICEWSHERSKWCDATKPYYGIACLKVARAQRLYLMNHVNHEMWHYIKKKQEVNTSLVGFVSPPQIHVGHSALSCQSSSLRSSKRSSTCRWWSFSRTLAL